MKKQQILALIMGWELLLPEWLRQLWRSQSQMPRP